MSFPPHRPSVVCTPSISLQAGSSRFCCAQSLARMKLDAQGDSSACTMVKPPLNARTVLKLCMHPQEGQ